MSALDPTDPRPSPPLVRATVPRLGWRTPVLLACVGLAALAYRGALAVGEGGTHAGPEAEAFLFEPTASSPTLVFGAAIWMFWQRWGRLRAALGAPPRSFAGALALVGALVLALWAWKVSVPSFLLPSLTLWILGAALWLGGTLALRIVWLPALFLLFAYPIPTVLINQVIYPLQLAVTHAAVWLLDLLGFPVVGEGDRLSLRGVTFQVIESCSGLRGTATIVMSSVLYVELFHQSRLRSALIVAAAPAIGVLTNQVRVLTIVLNPYAQIAVVHSAQGLAMIVVAVLLLAVWDAVLGRLLPASGPRPRHRLPPRTPLSPLRLAVLGGASLALAVASLAVRPWVQPRVPEQPLAAVSIQGLGEPQGLRLDQQFLGSTAFTEWVRRSYGTGAERVELFLGGDDRASGGVRILSLKTAVLDSAWSIEERGRTRLASGREAEWFVLRSGTRRQLAWRWHEGVAGTGEEVARALLAIERSPLRRPGRAVAVRLSTPIGSGGGSRVQAEERLAALAAQIEGSLPRILESPI
ncbi:MAG: exosortase/archaeosortase family protein [Deltaproteobacteria bacterium]|nr:exosortase/archaeosortase family protein [Deltaproteobacteria bacterium]